MQITEHAGADAGPFPRRLVQHELRRPPQAGDVANGRDVDLEAGAFRLDQRRRPGLGQAPAEAEADIDMVVLSQIDLQVDLGFVRGRRRALQPTGDQPGFDQGLADVGDRRQLQEFVVGDEMPGDRAKEGVIDAAADIAALMREMMHSDVALAGDQTIAAITAQAAAGETALDLADMAQRTGPVEGVEGAEPMGRGVGMVRHGGACDGLDVGLIGGPDQRNGLVGAQSPGTAVGAISGNA